MFAPHIINKNNNHNANNYNKILLYKLSTGKFLIKKVSQLKSFSLVVGEAHSPRQHNGGTIKIPPYAPRYHILELLYTADFCIKIPGTVYNTYVYIYTEIYIYIYITDLKWCVKMSKHSETFWKSY